MRSATTELACARRADASSGEKCAALRMYRKAVAVPSRNGDDARVWRTAPGVLSSAPVWEACTDDRCGAAWRRRCGPDAACSAAARALSPRIHASHAGSARGRRPGMPLDTREASTPAGPGIRVGPHRTVPQPARSAAALVREAGRAAVDRVRVTVAVYVPRCAPSCAHAVDAAVYGAGTSALRPASAPRQVACGCANSHKCVTWLHTAAVPHTRRRRTA